MGECLVIFTRSFILRPSTLGRPHPSTPGAVFVQAQARHPPKRTKKQSIYIYIHIYISSGEPIQSHHASPLHVHTPLAEHFPLWDPSPPPSSNIQVHTSGCTGPEFGIGYIGIYMGSGQQHACIYLCISLYRRCGHTRLQCCTRRPIYSFCSHQQGMNSKCIDIYIYGVLAVIGHALGYCQCAE